MAGRTFGGHALPITFGFKAAVWLSSVLRHAERVRAAVARPIPGEFAGAAGTLASLQEQGLAVRRAFMRRLRLPEPTITWAAMRDEVFVRVAALAGLTNSLAKIAQDIAELGSTEIGEVAEPHAGGKDTSSTLPLKANPILCAHTVAAATLVGQNAMSVLLAGRQRQERSGEALLELQVVGPAFIAAERCLDLAVLLLEDLQVFPSRMRRNLDGTRGVMLGERFMMALAPRLGRLQAHDLVHEARATIGRVRAAGALREFDCLYLALGCDIQNDLALQAGAARDGEGGLLVNGHQQTSVDGLYAAGDLVRGLNQIAVATAEAAIAATDIHNRLRAEA